MRAGRLGRLAGLVLTLTAVAAWVTVASGGYTTMDFEWGAPASAVVVDSAVPSLGAGSVTGP